MPKRVGKFRHHISLQSRDGDESGTSGTTVTYTTIVSVRANVDNLTGYQMTKKRGTDQENTHRIELRRVPNLSKANYVLVLSGPFKGYRIKIDAVQDDVLGRRVVLRGYAIGEKDAFIQPDKGSLPEIL